jgi:hypothetical protein
MTGLVDMVLQPVGLALAATLLAGYWLGAGQQASLYIVEELRKE